MFGLPNADKRGFDALFPELSDKVGGWIEDRANDYVDMYKAGWHGVKNAYEGKVDDKYDYFFQSALSGVPIVGDLMRSRDSTRSMEDYLSHRSMSWSDIKYPMNFINGGMAGLGRSGTNFIGDMVKELYL